MDPDRPVKVRLACTAPHRDGDALHDLGSVGADLVEFLGEAELKVFRGRGREVEKKKSEENEEKKLKNKKTKKLLSLSLYLSHPLTMWHPTTSSVAESTIIFISVASFLPESVLRMGRNLETKMS